MPVEADAREATNAAIDRFNEAFNRHDEALFVRPTTQPELTP